MYIFLQIGESYVDGLRTWSCTANGKMECKYGADSVDCGAIGATLGIDTGMYNTNIV